MLQIYVRFCICQQTEVKVSQIVRLLEKKQAEHDALEQSYLSLKKTVNQLTQVNDNNRSAA